MLKRLNRCLKGDGRNWVLQNLSMSCLLHTLLGLTWVYQLSIHRALILLLVAHPHHYPMPFLNCLHMPSFKYFCLFLFLPHLLKADISLRQLIFFLYLLETPGYTYHIALNVWLNSSSYSLFLLTYTGITQCIYIEPGGKIQGVYDFKLESWVWFWEILDFLFR